MISEKVATHLTKTPPKVQMETKNRDENMCICHPPVSIIHASWDYVWPGAHLRNLSVGTHLSLVGQNFENMLLPKDLWFIWLPHQAQPDRGEEACRKIQATYKWHQGVTEGILFPSRIRTLWRNNKEQRAAYLKLACGIASCMTYRTTLLNYVISFF